MTNRTDPTRTYKPEFSECIGNAMMVLNKRTGKTVQKEEHFYIHCYWFLIKENQSAVERQDAVSIGILCIFRCEITDDLFDAQCGFHYALIEAPIRGLMISIPEKKTRSFCPGESHISAVHLSIGALFELLVYRTFARISSWAVEKLLALPCQP